MDLRFLIVFLFQSVKLDATANCQINNCKHCTSNDECSVCNSGWFGATCKHQCRPEILSRCSICSDAYLRKDSGQYTDKYCSGCDTNEFVLNEDCKVCPKNCKTCSGLNNCTQCKDGFFGKSCQSKCPNNCDSCEPDALCQCKTGWQGDSCQCSPNCLQIGNTSEWCSINGTCTEGCLKGKRGRKCDIDCKNKCVECDQFSNRCLRCVNGWYGTNYCNKKCGHCSPANMVDISCDIKSGECRNGCANGYFGSKCDKECSNWCHDSRTKLNNCDKESGKCIFGCISGRYGEKCDVNCSIHCLNKTCYQSTGECKNGCIHGLNCTGICSKTCLNGSCNVTSGYCDIGCEPGWYGDICKDSCNINCANKSCDRQSGLCEDEGIDIDDGNYSQKCIGECVNNTCDIRTSHCLYGCKGGYDGPYCNKTIQADFSVIFILTSFGISGVLVLLVLFTVVCSAVRYALCHSPAKQKHEDVSKNENSEPVYEEISENLDEMAVLTNSADKSVHFDTIADSVIDTDSLSRKNYFKEGHYGTLTDKKHRYDEYTDLTLKLNKSRKRSPMIPPRIKLHNASNDAMTDGLQTNENDSSILLKGKHIEQYMCSDEVDTDEQLGSSDIKSEQSYLGTNVSTFGGRFSKDAQISHSINQDWIQPRFEIKPSSGIKIDDSDYLHPIS